MSLISVTELVAIKELRTIRHHAFSKTKSEKANMEVAITKPTHYVWLMTDIRCTEANAKYLVEPGVEPALLIFFDAKTSEVQKVFGRKGRSKALIHDEKLYFILTYYDVSGTSPHGGRDLRYMRKPGMQYLLKKATKKQYERAMEEIQENVLPHILR
jgi:hypothetical protein